MSGANLTVTGDDSIVAVILSDKALTVKLNGENRLVPDTDDKKAIYCGGALSLTGEGNLTAQADTTRENALIIDTGSLVMNGTVLCQAYLQILPMNLMGCYAITVIRSTADR